MSYNKSNAYAQLLLRFALAVTMLSAVADRFGGWGKNAAWGDWQHFESYTRQITAFLPETMSKYGAYGATFLEILFSLLLIVGYRTKIVALGTGLLLLTFALSMSITLGIKAPLDYSVWVGAAAAFLLASQSSFLFSIDNIKKRG